VKDHPDTNMPIPFALHSQRKSSWNWTPPRNEGIWRHGCAWLKPFFAASPWVSLALILSVVGVAANRISLTSGTTFLLPEATVTQAKDVVSDIVVLIMPISRDNTSYEETVIFFNDSRYILTDPSSAGNFKSSLNKRISESENGAIVLLADKRVNTGDLLGVVALAREAGAKSVQIAEKRE
jgi:biopolymer transport protein ExbD